jgi:hypothetical protein
MRIITSIALLALGAASIHAQPRMLGSGISITNFGKEDVLLEIEFGSAPTESVLIEMGVKSVGWIKLRTEKQESVNCKLYITSGVSPKARSISGFYIGKDGYPATLRINDVASGESRSSQFRIVDSILPDWVTKGVITQIIEK